MLGRINQTSIGHEHKPLQVHKMAWFPLTPPVIKRGLRGKEDEPKEEEIMEPNAAKGDDHSITVRTKEVEEESEESDEETEEEEEDDPK
ncbi:hypothetical protein Tco_0573881 [Tanacetum coccineum]